MSIDVEGWEIEVMRGLDTNNINCRLIVVENYLNDSSYKEYFESIGYILSDVISYNHIYLKQ